MMSNSIKWTPEQQQAIQAGERKILVAAAAGSGKTAVLVERIIQRLLDPANPLDLDRLLVVTFTEAAASEMRTRIGAALTKELNQDPANRHLKRQLALLHKAQISTLHSFCLSVVRRYFYKLGIDPAAQVMGERESLLLEQEVLEQVLEDRYTTGSEFFFQLAEIYGSQREGMLGEEILRIARFLRALPFPDQWLEEALAYFEEDTVKPLEEMPWYPEFISAITLTVEAVLSYHRQALALAALPQGPAAYLDNLQEEYEGIQDFLEALQQGLPWPELQDRYTAAAQFGKLKPIKKTDQVDEDLKNRVTDLRNSAKKAMQDLEKYFMRSREEYRQELLAVGPILKELVSVVQDFMEAYQNAKARKGQLDFSDLEHYCLQLLCHEDEAGQIGPSPIARELAQQYQEIMVDEYQDTNDLQDFILKMLTDQGAGNDFTPPRLFMVGDVKQSIYRFRMANPGLFLAKYLAYSMEEGSPSRKILLSANFRSRREVVDGVNWIFRRIMTRQTGELDYDESAQLVYSANYREPPPGVKPVAGPVELHVINSTQASDEKEIIPDEAELTSLEKEAQLIAYRIRLLVGLEGDPPVYVWDKNIDDYRPVTFKDIVILLRNTKDKANVLLDVLQQYNIPVYAELGTGYFQATEVSIMLSLLKIIDNPDQDIPLAAVLRSPILNLSTNELARIRLHKPVGSYWEALQSFVEDAPATEPANKLKRFLTDLDRWRTLARQGPLSRLIWQIYEETAFLDYAGAMPGGRQRKANLYALYDRAREFDAFSRHGLFRFLRFIEKLQEDNEDLGLAGAYGESDNVVRIMSIHKSKGLEFPVVIVANLGGRFNFKDLARTPLVHQDFGFGPMHCDLQLRVKYPTIAYWGVRASLEKSTLAEELRILYVALTRAKEKLILVGSTRELEEMRQRWEEIGREGDILPLSVLATAKSFLDWLGPALAHSDRLSQEVFETYFWEVPFGRPLPVPGQEIQETGGLPWDRIKQLLPIEQEVKEKEEELARRLKWQYPFLPSTENAAKLSVTELKRRLQIQDEEAQPVIRRSALSLRPRFMQETQALTGAEQGTAMHLVMQHLDLQAVGTKELINRQIEKMVEDEFLTAEQAQAVGWKMFLDFFQSPLGQRLVQAPGGKVKREVAFTLGIPAREIYPELAPYEEDEKVIIQGIIDCLLLEEDGITIIDYKTDNIGEKDLPYIVGGYRYQLDLYAKAVQEIYAMPVKEKYLYFFQLGRAVPVH